MRRAHVALVLAATVGLTACSGAATPEDSFDPTSSTSTPAPTEPLPTPSDTELQGGPEHGEEPAPAAEASTSDAIAVASELMALFARPDVDAQQWINDLYPYLTASAGEAYGYTDPANIECHGITGEPRIEGEPNDFYTVVIVPTDAGDFRVELERLDTASPWLADRIRPVE